MDDISNVDVAGLFYNLQPEKTYKRHDHHVLYSQKLAVKSLSNVTKMSIRRC